MTDESDSTSRVRALRDITRTIRDRRDRGGSPEGSRFLGLRGAASSEEARLAALNLLEDAIESRETAGRESLARERAEQATRDSEQYFRRAIEAAPIPVIVHTEDGRILQLSRTWSEVTGYPVDDRSDLRTWLSRLCGPNAASAIAKFESVFEGDGDFTDWELDVVTAAGDRRHWLLSSAAPGRLTPGRRYAVCMALDITERTRTEAAHRRNEQGLQEAKEELERRVAERTVALAQSNAALVEELNERRTANVRIHSLVRRLVSIQEEERRSVARDIHDQLGQYVTALRLTVETLVSASEGLDDVSVHARRALTLAQEIDRTVDFLTWHLRPADTDRLPLPAALANLVQNWSEWTGVEAEYREQDASELECGPDVQSHIYRVVQEALHNAYKHAHANRVRVLLSRQAGSLHCTIRDDGVGFDQVALERAGEAARPGLGMASMRERATLLGGELNVRSTPGAGTTVSLVVPLNRLRTPS